MSSHEKIPVYLGRREGVGGGEGLCLVCVCVCVWRGWGRGGGACKASVL